MCTPIYVLQILCGCCAEWAFIGGDMLSATQVLESGQLIADNLWHAEVSIMVGSSGFANGDPINQIIGTGANNLPVFKVCLNCCSSDEAIQGFFTLPLEAWNGSAFGKASMIFVANASISSINNAFLDNWWHGHIRVWWAFTCIHACWEVFAWIKAWRWLSKSQCAHLAFTLSLGAIHRCRVKRELQPVRRIGAGAVRFSKLLTSWTMPVTPPISLRYEHCASGGPGTMPPPSTNSSPFSDSILQAKEPFIHWGTKEPTLSYRARPLEKSLRRRVMVSDWFKYWCVQHDNGDGDSALCLS